MQVVKIANYSNYSWLERRLHLNSLMIMKYSHRRGIIFKSGIFQVIKMSLEGNKVFLVNFIFCFILQYLNEVLLKLNCAS